MGVVLDEAEAAGRLGEAVEAHDQALDLAHLREELVDLLLRGVERQVAHVEGRGVGEGVDGRLGWGVAIGVVVTVVAAAFVLGRLC